jgi:hypothetical protein
MRDVGNSRNYESDSTFDGGYRSQERQGEPTLPAGGTNGGSVGVADQRPLPASPLPGSAPPVQLRRSLFRQR